MEVVLTPALLAYMQQKNRQAVVLEVATANTSDVEITELFCRLARARDIPYLVEKKQFRTVAAPGGTALLPNYRLHYDDVVTFDVRKTLWFHSLTVTGVRI